MWRISRRIDSLTKTVHYSPSIIETIPYGGRQELMLLAEAGGGHWYQWQCYSIKAGLISNWTSFVMLLFLFFAMDHFYSAKKNVNTSRALYITVGDLEPYHWLINQDPYHFDCRYWNSYLISSLCSLIRNSVELPSSHSWLESWSVRWR